MGKDVNYSVFKPNQPFSLGLTKLQLTLFLLFGIQVNMFNFDKMQKNIHVNKILSLALLTGKASTDAIHR